MGTGLSSEEALFVKGPGHFGDLVVGALEREQDLNLRSELGVLEQLDETAGQKPHNNSTKTSSSSSPDGFYLNSKEWQLITALCEKNEACTPDLLLPLLRGAAVPPPATRRASITSVMLALVVHLYLKHREGGTTGGQQRSFGTSTTYGGQSVKKISRDRLDYVNDVRSASVAVRAMFDDDQRPPTSALSQVKENDTNAAMVAAMKDLLRSCADLPVAGHRNNSGPQGGSEPGDPATSVSIQRLQDLDVFNRPVLCILMGYICAYLQMASLLAVKNSHAAPQERRSSSLAEHHQAALATLTDAVAKPITFIPSFYGPLVETLDKLLLDDDLGLNVNGDGEQRGNSLVNLIWHNPEAPEEDGGSRSGNKGNSGGSSSKGNTSDTSPTPVGWASLKEDFIGQRHVINELEELTMSKERGLSDDSKPTVLVFFGPSGHGKSELGKHLAKLIQHKVAASAASVSSSSRSRKSVAPVSPPRQLEDVEAAGFLSVLHMPNFCTKDSIYSLVDPPTAHVGEGILLSAIRKQPHLVVILDEFEKSTSDAVQNVWLSAFQKKGMLRSLKESSRSTSTEKVTFILTCNIADKLIGVTDRAAYLAAVSSGNAAVQQDFISKWSKSCTESLRAKFGDPFVNRIDKVLPFAPYSPSESDAFVRMQLRALSRRQFELGRRVAFTASLSQYLSTCVLETFHNPTPVMDALRPILLEATKEEEAFSQRYNRHRNANIISVVHASGTLTTGEWKLSLHILDLESDEYQSSSCSGTTTASPGRATSVCTSRAPLSPHIGARVGSLVPPSAGVVASVETTGVYELQTEKEELEQEVHSRRKDTLTDTELSTVKEVMVLKRELRLTKSKLLEAEKQVVTLSEKVVQLEYLTGTLLLCLMSCLYIISFVVSLQVLFGLVTLCLGAMYMFVKNFWMLLVAAVKGILRIMQSPYGAVVVMVLALLMYLRSGLMLTETVPCNRQL